MATIMPQSELLKKAIAWIGEGLAQGQDREKLMNEAAMRFNLSPKDMESLARFLKDEEPCG